MERSSLKKQIHNNLIAIISLVVALSTLLYTSWREETTEKNRTLRQASFEVLKNLGELQAIVNFAYYQKDKQQGSPYAGWGRMLLISDLSELLPPKVQQEITKLHDVWGENFEAIDRNEEAVGAISREIDASRTAIVDSIRYLR